MCQFEIKTNNKGKSSTFVSVFIKTETKFAQYGYLCWVDYLIVVTMFIGKQFQNFGNSVHSLINGATFVRKTYLQVKQQCSVCGLCS